MPDYRPMEGYEQLETDENGIIPGIVLKNADHPDGLKPGIYYLREETPLAYKPLGFDIRITIADDGKGMPEELKKTLFNPFVTGNRARTSGGGTGLGMTIAKRIVDLHGGSIRLVDPPDEGRSTEFEIIFHKGDPQWA